MSRIYPYVGPAGIRTRSAGRPRGREIIRLADVPTWAADVGEIGPDGYLPATFVIDVDERLLVADQHSEHVACAGGEPVLAAGEIFFEVGPKSARVVEVTNQSTGYCPEPESWEVVRRVLDQIGLEHPDGFTSVCVFRRCPACGMRNVVKDDWFYCGVCGTALPEKWNFV